jgi:hypothetical protein
MVLQTTGLTHSEILGYNVYLPLPQAYRSLSRPSSPLRAKASSMRPYLLSFVMLLASLVCYQDLKLALYFDNTQYFNFQNHVLTQSLLSVLIDLLFACFIQLPEQSLALCLSQYVKERFSVVNKDNENRECLWNRTTFY